MDSFDLGRSFDAIICLFSAIAYVQTVERLANAIATMGRHLNPRGVLLVQAGFLPDQWRPGHVDARFVDEPDLKIARVNVSDVREDKSFLHLEYLIGTPAGITHEVEEHVLGLFTEEQYEAAFRGAGLSVHHLPEGLGVERGLYIGVKGA